MGEKKKKELWMDELKVKGQWWENMAKSVTDNYLARAFRKNRRDVKSFREPDDKMKLIRALTTTENGKCF